jgi:hypothetical protein
VKIKNPLNAVQLEFNKLCDLGGGAKGGPARTKVQSTLKFYGKKLSEYAHTEITEHLTTFADRSPWHVCFAVGLSWGHLARLELTFTEAAVNLLENWNDKDLKIAKKFHMERGPDPIEQSLRGGYLLFSTVTLPQQLPASLKGYAEAQQRILGRVIAKDRPKYIGSWNATAMFMVGLFSNPALGSQLRNKEVLLPPGGPLFAGLSILYENHFLFKKPAGSALDDEAFETGALYENNDLFAETIKGASDFNMLDAHSGIYLLGTRHPASNSWISP